MGFYLKYLVLVLLGYHALGFASSHHPQEFLQSIRGTKEEGKHIVQHYCINCHAEKPLIPLGAPRIGVEADWILRVKNGLSELFERSAEGLNAMPARGGCFECSDEQLRLAILELLPDSLRKTSFSAPKVDKKDKMLK
ncbi:MAG: c-type cytochrome [Tatlockia sp.]